MARSDQLTGTGGTYYVMAQLALRGYHASCTFGNAPFVDILVAAPDGAKSVSLQVKTATDARRWRGRGEAAVVKELQWTLGHRLAKHARPGLFYAFVDLKDLEEGEVPDVYVVPSAWVKTFCAPWVDSAKWARLHVRPEDMEPFKNNWTQLKEALSVGG
jgi:hypothetical protein